MKDIKQKLILILLALLMAAGSITMLTGCKEKKAPAPESESTLEEEFPDIEKESDELIPQKFHPPGQDAEDTP